MRSARSWQAIWVQAQRMGFGVAEEMTEKKSEKSGSALDKAIHKATELRPPPVLWLLGKTQSGKTSIIRALTGSERAAIGNGFRACTKTARLYDFPEEASVVRFLDTRGIGEVDYDPAEDLALCEPQAHLVLAVMKATDVRQDPVFDILRTLRKRHPDWPVVIAQTSLHEAYPPDAEHPQPYPFHWDTDDEDTGNLPAALMEALMSQRRLAPSLPGGAGVYWVPVDLTQPGDGYEPENFGLEALWQALEEASSLDLQGLLRGDDEVRDAFSRAAHPYIMGYSMSAAALGALPVVDLALVPTLQFRLLYRLGALYHHRWTRRTTAEFLGMLGTSFALGYGLRWAGRSVVKLIPGWGQTAGAAWSASHSAAITYALGRAACLYLSRKSSGEPVNARAVRQAYAQALRHSPAFRSGDSSGNKEP